MTAFEPDDHRIGWCPECLRGDHGFCTSGTCECPTRGRRAHPSRPRPGGLAPVTTSTPTPRQAGKTGRLLWEVGDPPLRSGSKITTSSRVVDHALEKLAGETPQEGRQWHRVYEHGHGAGALLAAVRRLCAGKSYYLEWVCAGGVLYVRKNTGEEFA